MTGIMVYMAGESHIHEETSYKRTRPPMVPTHVRLLYTQIKLPTETQENNFQLQLTYNPLILTAMIIQCGPYIL
jgi:hypothetical protein